MSGGVRLGTSNSGSGYRLKDAIGLTPSDFNKFTPWQRRRCILDKEGNVVSYYGDDTYDETPNENVIGVFVEQPAFYVKLVGLGEYYISDKPIDGYVLCPGFHDDNGNPVDRIYLSAYEASVWDSSENTNDTDNTVSLDINNDWLLSVPNVIPRNGATEDFSIATAKTLAKNIGSGWNISTIFTLGITQLLFAIEYGTFDSQTAIGLGVVNKESGPATGNANLTGETASLGNMSGMADGTNGLVGVSYRGEENPWGNMRTYLDGCISANSRVFLKEYDTPILTDYTVALDTYTNTTVSLPDRRGYITRFDYYNSVFKTYPNVFIPYSVSTKNLISESPCGDMYYTNANYECIVLTSGFWTENTYAGLFYFMIAPYTASDRNKGARLLYVPQ